MFCFVEIYISQGRLYSDALSLSHFVYFILFVYLYILVFFFLGFFVSG